MAVRITAPIKLLIALLGSAACFSVYLFLGMQANAAVLSSLLAFGGIAAALFVPLPTGVVRERSTPALPSRAKMLETSSGEISSIAKAARSISDPKATSTLLRIVVSANAGLDALGEGRRLDDLSRQMVAYYIPQTKKLATALVAIENMTAEPAARARIVSMLSKLVPLFDSFADASTEADLGTIEIDLQVLGRALERTLEPR